MAHNVNSNKAYIISIYRIAGKFRGELNLVVWRLKSAIMVILYRTAKFKSASMFAMAIWDLTAKFNSRQYFRLYGIRKLFSVVRIIFSYSVACSKIKCTKIMCIINANVVWDQLSENCCSTRKFITRNICSLQFNVFITLSSNDSHTQ